MKKLKCLFSAPYTKYRLVVRAFTKRREGPASEALIIITDTEPPSPPRITNISCYGKVFIFEIAFNTSSFMRIFAIFIVITVFQLTYHSCPDIQHIDAVYF